MRRDDPPNLVDSLREEIATIITDLPTLDRLLPSGGRSINDRHIITTRETPLPIRTDILAMKDEITTWVFHLANILIEETTWRPPRPATAAVLLADIAHRRIGHFTEYPNPQVRADFTHDVHRICRKIEQTCWPRGVRWVPTTVLCATAVDGTPCPGEYHVRLDPAQGFSAKDPSTWPDFICRVKTQATDSSGEVVTRYHTNADHRVPFREWVFAGEISRERGTTPHDELVRGRR